MAQVGGSMGFVGDGGRDNGARTGRDGPFPVALALISLVLSVGLYSFLNSSYFHLTAFVVQGQRTISETDVLALAGVKPGDNILNIDLRALAARIATHPRVRHVHIRRQLPQRLTLVIQEHTPVAFVAAEDGEEGLTFVAVNDLGAPVPITDEEAGALPVIVSATPTGIRAGVAAASDMPAPLRARIDTIAVDEQDGRPRITAFTRIGGVILFGTDDELARKGAIAASLLEAADYAIVDVRFPRSPSVRPR